MPELALYHCETDDYHEYHHRTFVWRWMEIETETHIGSTGLSSQGAVEEQKEGEHEQGSQGHKGSSIH